MTLRARIATASAACCLGLAAAVSVSTSSDASVSLGLAGLTLLAVGAVFQTSNARDLGAEVAQVASSIDVLITRAEALETTITSEIALLTSAARSINDRLRSLEELNGQLMADLHVLEVELGKSLQDHEQASRRRTDDAGKLAAERLTTVNDLLDSIARDCAVAARGSERPASARAHALERPVHDYAIDTATRDAVTSDKGTATRFVDHSSTQVAGTPDDAPTGELVGPRPTLASSCTCGQVLAAIADDNATALVRLDQILDALGRLEATARSVAADARQSANYARSTFDRAGLLQAEVAETPALAAQFTRLAGLGIGSTTALPALGGWAASPDTIVSLIDSIFEAKDDISIVECGSGSSTVWLATALSARGRGGRVIALENDPEYAEKTRNELARHGLFDFAEVRDAPLEALGNADERRWYSLSATHDLENIDILFVDGPPGTSYVDARHPALAILGPRLSKEALVAIDDTGRDSERQLVELWLDAPGRGRHAHVTEQLRRTTVIRVTSTTDATTETA